MKKLYYLVAVGCLFFFSCQKEVEPVLSPAPEKSKSELLTGGNSKGWKYTVHQSATTCPNSQKFHNDNTYSFSADQKMTFSNGTVTEEGNCGDFASLEGYWRFSKNEDSLYTYATRRVDTGMKLDSSLLIGGKLLFLSADKFVLGYKQDSIVFTPRTGN